ncbi:ABC transporter ATP-binding protein [Dyadobacter sp. LJ53]|uniref:ABC transporter ATP-binding protein n=1 Tax=Dyadobacter chenwenxiniae TaxID=2906456 RepID=UPI001F18E74E|nr:ABC transporter ATP-binding protein [Dyadobacter chenwenxiniae]MCF0053483.1 ABC transporter ATP-binding protein [Dyadobacter chenwenxiniae]
MEAVIVKNISKTYGIEKALAVDNVSFSVSKGELFGLIGPDGAGKTSIFRMLTTLLLPDEGSASVDGFDIVKDFKQIRSAVGYMPGKFSLYQDLTIEENLNFFATVFGTTVEENYHLIQDIYIQIEPFKKRRAGKLSGGMKQKLALCCALIHKPATLFLDEPTTGVDPVSRREFWEMLRRLKEHGITIIVSTPYMDEAALCDRVALIQSGKILSIDTPENVTKAYPTKLYAIKANEMYRLLKSLDNYPDRLNSYAFGEYAHATFSNKTLDEAHLKRFLADQGLSGIEIKSIPATIEDSFIKLLN